jgi:hypothetical protein
MDNRASIQIIVFVAKAEMVGAVLISPLSSAHH